MSAVFLRRQIKYLEKINLAQKIYKYLRMFFSPRSNILMPREL